MALNSYFTNGTTSEQNLLQSLVTESIQVRGLDVYYLPRTAVNMDNILGQDISKFDSAIKVEMFLRDVDGFAGDGDMMSKFGLEIRDQVYFIISKTTWENLNLSVRPLEGDLIYFPMTSKLFEISFVEHELPFYQLKNLYAYELTCDLFTYSDESIDTGIVEIDTIEINESYTRTFELENISGSFVVGEVVTGGSTNAQGEVAKWDSNSNYLYLINLTKTFGQSEIITGADSLSTGNLLIKVSIPEEVTNVTNTVNSDNVNIQIESDELFNFSVTDPFSEGNY